MNRSLQSGTSKYAKRKANTFDWANANHFRAMDKEDSAAHVHPPLPSPGFTIPRSQTVYAQEEFE